MADLPNTVEAHLKAGHDVVERGVAPIENELTLDDSGFVRFVDCDHGEAIVSWTYECDECEAFDLERE